MKKRLVSVLLFALTVSAGAAFVLYQLISQKVSANASTPRTAMVKTFVATRNLEVGSLVRDADLEMVDWPADRAAGALMHKEEIVNRGAAVRIQQGWPFSESVLAPKGAGAGFASTIPKGMRAFSVHVNEVVGVAGFAIAGMRVDVLVAGAPAGAPTGGVITRTLLQNIEVLSAGQNYQKDAEGKPVLVPVVNVLVTPAQAEVLNLATEMRIQLVLRNPADREIVTTPGAVTANLFSAVPRTIAPSLASALRPFGTAATRSSTTHVEAAAKKETVTVEVLAGDKRTELSFPNPDSASPERKQ